MKIGKVSDCVNDIVDNLLNVEAAESLPELNFQIACLDAGCIPPLIGRNDKRAIADLRAELVRTRDSLRPQGDDSRHHRYKG